MLHKEERAIGEEAGILSIGELRQKTFKQGANPNAGKR